MEEVGAAVTSNVQGSSSWLPCVASRAGSSVLPEWFLFCDFGSILALPNLCCSLLFSDPDPPDVLGML
jgi:hypothetical protein